MNKINKVISCIGEVELSNFMKDNGVDFFFTETWLSAQGDEVKTVELAKNFIQSI